MTDWNRMVGTKNHDSRNKFGQDVRIRTGGRGSDAASAASTNVLFGLVQLLLC